MTARTLDPAAVIAAAGAELVAELEQLLAEHAHDGPDDVPGLLLDAVTTLLRRARRRVGRARQPAEQPAGPAPPVDPAAVQRAAADQWGCCGTTASWPLYSNTTEAPFRWGLRPNLQRLLYP